MDEDADEFVEDLSLPWRRIGCICMILTLVLVPVFYALLHVPHRDETVRAIDTQINSLETVLDAYEVDFGVYPTGDTRAIFRALAGDNPKGIQYVGPQAADSL